MSFVGLVGVLGVVLSIAFAWPQALEARRADDVTGISGPANMLLLLTATTWTIYSVAVADTSLTVANIVTIAAAAVTLEALLRQGHLPAVPSMLLMGSWAVALAAVMLATRTFDWGPAPIGMLGAALGISMSVPQAWRVSRGHGTDGVALSTYVLLMGVMSTWLVYGLLQSDPVIWVPNVIGVVVVGFVVGVLVSHARRPDVRVMLADGKG